MGPRFRGDDNADFHFPRVGQMLATPSGRLLIAES